MSTVFDPSTVFDSRSRQNLLERIGRLRGDSERRWGTMTVEEMLQHAGRQLRVGLGEIDVPAVKGPMSWPGVRWLVIRVVPWPHGTKTAPQLVARSPEDLEQERQGLCELIERFAEHGASGELSPHPLFGRLPARLWGQLAYRHVDYHLKQFSS